MPNCREYWEAIKGGGAQLLTISKVIMFAMLYCSQNGKVKSTSMLKTNPEMQFQLRYIGIKLNRPFNDQHLVPSELSRDFLFPFGVW